jgi:indole-3-glycerol phosphate synthase
VPDLARQYKHGGADAISVLTEPLHFQGSLEYLAAVRHAVDLPLLRKDFIIDPYQLIEARAYGADAVLLIATALERHQLYDLHQAAADLGLECLVEVYDPRELDKLDFTQVKILGVNNRDLRTFEVDIEHSLRTFAQAPDTVVRVSESGLGDAKDLAHLRRNGVHAVLIGETFMRAPHPGEAVRALKDDTEYQLSSTSALRLVG